MRRRLSVVVIALVGFVTNGARSSAPASRYVNVDDKTVKDTVTGLTWEKSSDHSTYHDEAVRYCEQLTGGSWRLPSRAELLSLVDPAVTDREVALDPKFDGTAELYWTSTAYARETDTWWCLAAGTGATYPCGSASKTFRCVRGPG